MNKNTILTLMTLMLITVSYGQKKASHDTIYMETVRSVNAKNYKVRAAVNVLILEDGTALKKGSVLVLGQPSNSDFEKVENTAVNFTQVFGDRFSLMQNTACDGGLEPSWSNTKIIISEIKLHRKSKDLIVNFTIESGGKVCSGDYGHIINFQKAMDRREVVNLNAPMSKEEAMEKLLEAKKLYELEVLTKEEYDALKLKLTPILKGGN